MGNFFDLVKADMLALWELDIVKNSGDF